MAIDRLAFLDRLRKAASPGRWWAEDGREHWQLFVSENPDYHGRQIIKAPKAGTPYAEYWPNEYDAALIVAALNTLPAFLDLALSARLTHLRPDQRPRPDGRAVCESCYVVWPCPTRQALDKLDHLIALEEQAHAKR